MAKVMSVNATEAPRNVITQHEPRGLPILLLLRYWEQLRRAQILAGRPPGRRKDPAVAGAGPEVAQANPVTPAPASAHLQAKPRPQSARVRLRSPTRPQLVDLTFTLTETSLSSVSSVQSQLTHAGVMMSAELEASLRGIF